MKHISHLYLIRRVYKHLKHDQFEKKSVKIEELKPILKIVLS